MRKVHWVWLLAVLLWATGCRSTAAPEPALQRFRFNQPHMGTLFTLTLYAKDEQLALQAAKAAFKRIQQLDEIMTDYDPESELMLLCRKPHGQPVKVGEDLFRIFQLCEEVSRKTDGAFDMTVGPYVHLWRTVRKSRVLPTEGELAEAAKSVGWQKVKLDARKREVTLLLPGMKLDLGGIAKGYAADEALKVLRQHDCGRALVAASGDIAVGDAPPGVSGWKVGIASLDTPEGALPRTLILHNVGISTSGDTEQFVEIKGVRYSHIVDPKTGWALTNRIGDTIISRNATISDAYDTPVSIMGAERGMKLMESLPEISGLIVTIEGGRTNRFESKRFKKLEPAK
jgi:thiamine biosynthesis lipoprotein